MNPNFITDRPVLESVDPEITQRLVSRRQAIARGASASGAVMWALRAGSIPVALAAMSTELWGAAPTDVVGILNFALTLEYLEAEFYKAGTSGAAFATARSQLTAAEVTTLTQILKHENSHVAFLRTAITNAGGTPVTFTAANFDFTGGNGSGTGPFASATTSAAVLLAAAQAFEDTGVRAYKGQAGGLMGNKPVLTAALQIHSVEARHAAQIRRLRGKKSWITNNNSDIVAPAGSFPSGGTAQAGVDAIYAGEQNTTHKGANIAPLAAAYGGTAAATEAFDEPLTYDEVIAIVKDFIVGSNP